MVRGFTLATRCGIVKHMQRTWSRQGVSKLFFDQQFPSTFESMADVLSKAMDALLHHRWISSGSNACTRLCLEEALVNAIRHGNQCDPNRMVRLEMLGNGEMCTIRVRDEGAGFSPEEVKLPDCDQLGGRGVCLIRHYMDRVRFDKDKHCLEMAFRRKI
jgi:anti-sigma regulatory factor (Ser/Thr protein kinase)